MKARSLYLVTPLLALALLLPGASAAQEPKEEGERLRAQVDSLRAELKDALDEYDTELSSMRDSLRHAQQGTSRFFVGGYGFAGYTHVRNGEAVFGSEFSPLVVWHLDERLHFAAQLELEPEEELNVGLEYAYAAYHATGFLTVGAGKFLTPFGVFEPRLHPAWINKLPTEPLAFGDAGIAPKSSVGAFARGSFGVGTLRASYDGYVANAPELITSGSSAGLVEFVDESEERAVGGRVALTFLGAGLELGSSYQTSEAVTFYGVDAALTHGLGALGSVDLRFEAVRSQASNGPFADSTGQPTLGFVDNRHQGAYGQLAYRPGGPLNRLEAVVRYDRLDYPQFVGGLAGDDARGYSAGLAVHLAPSMKLEVAYEQMRRNLTGKSESIVVGTAIGF